MSLYLQQLLTSSGLVQPVMMASSLPTNAPTAPADIAEISEEIPAIPPQSSIAPRLVTETPVYQSTTDSGTAHPKNDRLPPPARADAEPGVVEIISSHIEETITRPDPLTAVSVKPARVAPTASPANKTRNAPAAPAPTAATAPEKSSAGESAVTITATPLVTKQASPEGVPSADELVQHVFRWVAQNPADRTPPALNDYSSAAAEPAKSVAPKPTVHPSIVTAAHSPEPQTAAPDRAPERPRTRTHPPAPAVAVESTVEISIGTLQIQVEAPPATAAKPTRRPAVPRPAGAAATVLPRPAIDLNRLRRGFYL